MMENCLAFINLYLAVRAGDWNLFYFICTTSILSQDRRLARSGRTDEVDDNISAFFPSTHVL